ncbi:MAG: LytTR family DNA-binding domain-containing protein [Saprospiraceae bacterium]|jgi:two-component system, LytTR family, response regulator|nr:LytTR family DNA-binding domain-containing protein [Saprospiraceae bacterium]
MIRAVIVEDEFLSAELLDGMIHDHCPEVRIVGIAHDVSTAIALITKETPDIVFLDIEMQTGSGFDVLHGLKNKSFKVIFTTAYDHYALKAIKFSAVDYLLKPIDVLELKEAVSKLLSSNEMGTESKLDLLMRNLHQNKLEDLSISLSTLDGIEFVPIKSIIHLEANGPYTHFYFKDRPTLMISKNLKEYEIMLADHGFYRVHNSHLINLSEVKKIIKSDGGYAIMKDDSSIAISPKKKDELMVLLNRKVL